MNTIGMNGVTGTSLGDIDHIRQSIRDILTTRIGTRTMRRTYGSMVPELLDQPGNQTMQLRLMAATVMAIIRWEPRVLIARTAFSMDMAGKCVVDIEGLRRDGQRAGQPISFKVAVA
jgi:uncharacterized protein